ncbi:MAG: DMT family transporter [Armatimonadetes bacterium]|nr:MAG: DMT family transporter [Armatimonadota bacterium]
MTVVLPLAVLIVLSAILSIYSKKTLNNGIHPLVLLTFSSILVGLFLLPIIYIWAEQIQNIRIIFLIAIASGFHFLAALLINKSIQLSELSFITAFTSFTSIFGLLFSIILFKDYPTFAGLLGVLIIVSGAFLIHGPERNIQNIKPIFFRIIGSMFIALSAAVIKISFKDLNYIISTGLLWVFLALFSAPVLICFVKNNKKHREILVKNLNLLILVSFLAISVSVLTIYLFGKTNIGYVYAFLQLSIIFTILLSKKMLNEIKYARRIIPAIVMILGMIIIYYLG